MPPILVVCTGNVCRSPMAEGFLRAALGTRFGDLAPGVASAGTAGWEGSGAMREAVVSAAERGADISTHVARLLSPRDIWEAHLVLAMAGEHRDVVTTLAPMADPKSFTLKELARLVEALPAPTASGDPTQRLVARVTEAHRLRRSGFRGDPRDEDIADPLGQPLESYRAVAWELDEWSARLLDGLFGQTHARAGAAAEGE
jgi:protein-tyrosine phosphatase